MKRFHSFQAEAFLSDRKRVFRMIEIPLSIVLAVIALFFYLNRDVVHYDATMYGTLVSAEGEVLDQVEFSIRMTARPTQKVGRKMNFTIEAPEEFPYFLFDNQDIYYYYDILNAVYMASAWCYNRDSNGHSLIDFALDKENGYFIMFCFDPDSYLIASADPNVKWEDVLEEFDAFMQDDHEKITFEDIYGDIKIEMKSEYDE